MMDSLLHILLSLYFQGSLVTIHDTPQNITDKLDF